MSDDDLIRRGDATNAVYRNVDGPDNRIRANKAIDALPADPRAVLPPDARERIARVLWSFPRNRQSDESWEEIMRHAPPEKWPHGTPAEMLRQADAILAGLAAQPEPAREYEKTTDPATGETLYVRPAAQPKPAPLPSVPVDPDGMTHTERLAELARLGQKLREKLGIQGGLGR